MPEQVTTNWWKEERGQRVFIDFNQANRDRTMAGAYSPRALPTATVATPITWDELASVDPASFTVRTVPPEGMREVSLQVGGIAAGPMACAVINDRLVQVGETIESLAVERIEPDAVLLRHSGKLLRLPVAEKAIRVRLPL